jgi:aconitase A
MAEIFDGTLPRRDQLEEPRFQLQTAVMTALIPACTEGSMNNWRAAADLLCSQLDAMGYAVEKKDG